MSEVTQQASPTADINSDQLDRLTKFLNPLVTDGLAGPLSITLLSGGRSNLTYVIGDGRREWVLRRPPLGHVLETAHDMHREFRVINGLRDTAVPVPAAVGYCADPGILGASFYVMERVEGIVYRTAEDYASLGEGEPERLAHAFLDAFAQLHLLDYSSVGLSDFGRPDGYLERQVRRWGKQLESSRSRPIDGFDELARRLAASTPLSQRSSIVHGDPRLDNAIVTAGDAGSVRALLDWEMATLGDPLADAGLFYLFWEGWSGLDQPIAAAAADDPRFPKWDQLAERYATATGLDLTPFPWYAAFAFYKFAVICEGIHFRHVKGLTIGEGFDEIGAMVPDLVQRALVLLPA
jgi:aminoglycoside phosphotransferase (APT) family kinase protein